jgi:predicted metal-dependent hydrolase
VNSIELGGETVPVRIERRRRRSIGVVVRDDGSVEARAPLRASERRIRDVVEECRPWLERRRAEVLERLRQRARRRFADGEAVPYLGDELTLRVLPTPAALLRPPERSGRTLAVRIDATLPETDHKAEVRRQVLGWLLERAQEVFHERHRAAALRIGHAATRIVIKDMRTRWGSCGPDRRMSLNWRLVLAPRRVIDYVLVHELAHVDEPNHSPRFWRRVGAALPAYEEARRWLRDHGESLEL